MNNQDSGDAMEDISDLSGSSLSLSLASSRTEHMAYLRDVLRLDSTTATLLYRAERLQEKGQFKQALKYYHKVLQLKPDCEDAAENAAITAELLKEEEKQNPKSSLGRIPESAYPTVEMEVFWSDMDNWKYDYECDPERAAFAAAKVLLNKTGHGDSLLKLLKNEVQENRCDAETEYETYMRGKALFQVTLIKENEDIEPSSLELETMFRLFQKPGQFSQANRQTEIPTINESQPSVAVASEDSDEEVQFEDAQESYSL